MGVDVALAFAGCAPFYLGFLALCINKHVMFSKALHTGAKQKAKGMDASTAGKKKKTNHVLVSTPQHVCGMFLAACMPAAIFNMCFHRTL
jgi:hypothetical protein